MLICSFVVPCGAYRLVSYAYDQQYISIQQREIERQCERGDNLDSIGEFGSDRGCLVALSGAYGAGAEEKAHRLSRSLMRITRRLCCTLLLCHV